MTRRLAPAFVLALALGVAGCHNPDDYGVTASNVNAFLSLTESATSVPADGFSTITLTAAIDPNATTGNRTVTFATSAGTLIAAGQRSTTSLDVAADAAGHAAVQLQSSSTPTVCRVTAKIKDFVQVADIQFAPADASSVISLAASSAAGAADGATLIQITATIAAQLPSGSRTVQFTASDGTFSGGNVGSDGKTTSVTADGNNRAIVQLKAPTQPTTVQVTGTVSGTSSYATIRYDAAAPDSIFVSAANAVIGANDTDAITVSLLRNTGVATPHAVVTYTVTDANGNVNTVGAFSNIQLSSTNGSITTSSATYNPAGTAYRGPLTIQASSGGVSGSTVIRIQ